MTCWWVLLASLPLHTCCWPPTSHCDSLVVFRCLCTLLQPPTSCYSSLGGYPRQSPIFTPAANHQRVIVTHWWLFIASAPSFNHQQVFTTRWWVLVVVSHSPHLLPPTNESLQLIGGFSSSPPPTTCNSNHQRVFMTCWWVFIIIIIIIIITLLLLIFLFTIWT